MRGFGNIFDFFSFSSPSIFADESKFEQGVSSSFSSFLSFFTFFFWVKHVSYMGPGQAR